MVTAEDIISTMLSLRSEEQRVILQRFFKTGKGEYGEGDKFLGIKVPCTRVVVKHAKNEIETSEVVKLLYSEWHEVRLCGFLLLVEKMTQAIKKKDKVKADEIAELYLDNARQANNWDLVDLSCYKILGEWLLFSGDDRGILYDLSESDSLWEQRIAIVSTMALIKHGQFDEALNLAKKYETHPHDLIQKAVGWMLREVGKKDESELIAYLDRNSHVMPRTTLRYAIERLPQDLRHYYLSASH